MLFTWDDKKFSLSSPSRSKIDTTEAWKLARSAATIVPNVRYHVIPSTMISWTILAMRIATVTVSIVGVRSVNR